MKNKKNITHFFMAFIRIIILSILFSSIGFSKSEKDLSFEGGIIYISEFILSEEFKKLAKTNSDINLVDTIYVRMLKYYENDISETLLALTFATLPFNKMPVKLPFLKNKLSLKLPSINENYFTEKKKILPGIIFFDSRNTGFKDKDKVAHFFGNAFLSYNLTYINASKFFGIFVELFESTFKVSGGVDRRDLQANSLGDYFGNALSKNPKAKPSEIFNMYSLFYFSYTW